MTGSLPSGPRIDRAALERIIKRAAELQATEKEIGDNLTEQELFGLADDVGINEGYLRQALAEERTRVPGAVVGGPVAWLAGPRAVAAARSIGQPAARTETALHQWMTDGELLQVKRRYPDRTTWERQQGAYASLRRAFGTRGRRYTLARTREVAASVVRLDERRCHVRLVADISNLLSQRLAGAGVVTAAGAAGASIAVALGVMVPVALAPALVALPVAWVIARGQRRIAEETQVAVEQILDRLEHGEVDPRAVLSPRAGPLLKMADEIRRTLGA